jgi:hypothetical protein
MEVEDEMTSDELQQVIDDLDYARNLVMDEDVRRALRVAGDILTCFPDEAMASYEESAAARERQEAEA